MPPSESTPHRIGDDDVRHVARLSRLTLGDDEVHRYAEQLAAVLGYIDKLREVDVDGVEPMAHPLDLANVLRADEPGETLSTEAALANAPASQDGFFKVPKVLGGGGA